MNAQTEAHQTEAKKLVDEMYRLEASGNNEARLAEVYARLIELEVLIWGKL